MKPTIQTTLLALCLALTACKKEDATPAPGGGNSSQTIVNESSGWKVAQIIPYQKVPDAVTDATYLRGEDITRVGNEIAVLYGTSFNYTDKLLDQYLKVKFNETVGKTAGASTLLGYFKYPNQANPDARFVSTTFNAAFHMASPDVFNIYDETGKLIGFADQYLDTRLVYRYLPSGDFIMSSMESGYGAPLLSHFWTRNYSNPGFRIPEIYNDGIVDGVKRLLTMPAVFSDGAQYELSIGTQGNEVKFQLLKLVPTSQAGSADNNEVVATQTLGGLQAAHIKQDNNTSLLAYELEGDVATFVLADYGDLDARDLLGLHCYSWNHSTKTLTTLWQNTSLNADVKNAILKGTEERVTPQGTFYTLFTKEKYAEPNIGSQYTSLHLVNATGTKELGKITDDLYNISCALTTPRYINGAFYALAYPISTASIKPGNARFHIELVKITE